MSATTLAAPPGVAGLGRSNLTHQLERNDGEVTPKSTKSRSLSDAVKPSLSPSPAIRENSRRISKDDSVVDSPVTPRRPLFHARGLSLQMPAKDIPDAITDANTQYPKVPLSPKLDPNPIYGSPTSVLPRRSRGLDFARACTHLHHSTLAESSPDASPVAGRGINIPQRRSLGHNSVTGSPSQSGLNWHTANGERTTLSSSVSSINMMGSDSDSDSDGSSDMAVDDDPIMNTPAAARLNAIGANNSPGMEWLQGSPAQNSLMNFQPNLMSFRRARFRRQGKSSHSSSSVSMRSSKPSPGPLSPPIRPSVEAPSYFGLMKDQVKSRRESLSLGTDDLHLSDSDWDAEVKTNNDSTPERSVIRRPVTRRSNLLPKTKGFARIRAALMEESDPLHSDARREAEVIKQVHESDPDFQTRKPSDTSESLESAVHELQNNPFTERHPSFSKHAERNSAGLGFWNTFDNTQAGNEINRYRTPPPLPRESSSAMSDETMDSTTTTANSATPNNQNYSSNSLLQHIHRSRSRSTTPLASSQQQPHPPTAADIAKRVSAGGGGGAGSKRRRDDAFDPASFKRRAVSPGMSAQSSPVVPQSPTMLSLNGDKTWGRPPSNGNSSNGTTGNHNQNNSSSSTGFINSKGERVERSNSGGSSVSRDGSGSVKRVGLLGMTEANDGFMSMSID